MAKWSSFPSVFHITFELRQAENGHIIASLLNDFPVDDIPNSEEEMESLPTSSTISQENIMASRKHPLPYVVGSAEDTHDQQSTFPLGELPLVQLCSTSFTSVLCSQEVEDLFTIYTDGSCNKVGSSVGCIIITPTG